jgi:hypothetical protein
MGHNHPFYPSHHTKTAWEGLALKMVRVSDIAIFMPG